MVKRWRLKPAPDPGIVHELTYERCPTSAATILAQRGITDKRGAAHFFRPSLADLHDPFLIAGMQQAVERIERALGDNERIMVFGDYDVDGTTAVALVYGFLARFTGNLTFYIPDRYAEGYGISTQGIDKAKEEGVGLIIALDCGIKSVEKVAYARERGIDFIICDHHLPGDQLPEAVAVLDPKRPDCPYPFKELSGCGIGFKLMQGFAQRNGIEFEELESLLDLVAISTACDIVPVGGENRILCHFGLQRINDKPRPGVRAILGMANVKKRLGVGDLVFSIGPRINAAGRIEHGRKAVELLLAHEEQQAVAIATLIDGNNSHRQELDRNMTEEALAHIAEDEWQQSAWSTVVFNPDWHKGVVGIVASRLTERHYKPTVVLTASNGKAVGSARSVKGFDVYEAISACSDLLEQFGGHMYAAGLTMPLENVEAFRARFDEAVRAMILPEQRIPEEDVDLELRLDAVDDGLLRVIRHMAPYGPGNMRPVFLARGVVDSGSARLVGEHHLKMRLLHPDAPRRSFDAIAFKQANWLELVRSGKPFSVLYTLEDHEWQGRVSTQLNIKDIKPGVEGVLLGEESLSELNPRSPRASQHA
ncbi:MAG: single-stranded-DNA-specific exonuclease RecJ [Flavobacteriales bacterium]|nr:single-stranded-DNA-specific exonuclease RecJ [Flavobacteriales bacterium]